MKYDTYISKLDLTRWKKCAPLESDKVPNNDYICRLIDSHKDRPKLSVNDYVLKYGKIYLH